MDQLAATAGALIVNNAVTSILGMIFWVGASRLYSPGELGGNAALISVMMLLSVISQLDLGMGISRLLPQVRERPWRPVLAAYGVSTVTALIVGVGFVTVAPHLSASLAFLGREPALAGALVVAVVLWNVFALQDAVLASARWARAIPLENGLFGVLKIALMLCLVHRFSGRGIFIAWLAAMAVMLVPVNSLIFWKVLPESVPAEDVPESDRQATLLPIADRARVARYLALDYVAGLFNQGYTALLPLLVLTVLGREANAYFYIAFVIAAAVRSVAQSMGTSLVVEAAHDDSKLGSLTRLSVVRYVKFALPATVALVIGVRLLLLPFGSSYVRHGATVLVLLLLATVPQAAIALYYGVERVRARVGRVMAVEAAIVLLVTIGGTVAMAAYGLVGLGLAWLVTHVLVATVIVPRLWGVCREASGREKVPDDVRRSAAGTR